MTARKRGRAALEMFGHGACRRSCGRAAVRGLGSGISRSAPMVRAKAHEPDGDLPVRMAGDAEIRPPWTLQLPKAQITLGVPLV